MEGKLSGLLAFADGTNSTLHCGAILQGDQSLPLNGAHEGRSFIPQNTLKIIIGDDEFDAADLDEKMSYSSNMEPHLAEIRKCYFELPRRLVKDSFVIRFGGFLAETKDINISISTPETQSAPASVPAAEAVAPTNVVSAITSNKWSGEFLVVSGTLTNASAVAVAIKAIDSQGFDANQKIVAGGSDFTSFRKDLSPGEIVNFKILLNDTAKQVKFVKVVPSWSP